MAEFSLTRRDVPVRRATAAHGYDGSVVFWTDIFLLCVLGIFTLAILPQAFGRFRTRTDWWKGFIIYREKHIIRDDTSSITATNSRQEDGVGKVPGEPLRHTKSLTSRFYFITNILRFPLPFPGYNLGKGLLLLFYSCVLLFAALYRDSVFKNPTREGAIVASQLPWLYILATKNNALGTLVGKGYDKLSYIHRMVGRLVVLAANVHALGFIYKWVMAGDWTENIKITWIRWGLVALVAIDILFFLALHFIRQHYYNVFYVSHSIALVVLLVAICLHRPFAIPYVAIASGFYGVDHILRLVKSRMPTAYLEPLPDLGTTLVRIPTLNAGWRAGQFVRLRVLSRGMGWYAWSEAHPYTIASACEGPGGGEMVFMIKKCGLWTRKLYDIASAPADDDEKSERTVRVLVEGPYGGPGFTMFSSFSGALFICGGSGISFGLSAAQEILQRIAQGTSNVRTVELVWCAGDARSLSPLLPCSTSLLEQSYTLPVTLTIQVFCTRALTKDDHHKHPALEELPRGLSYAPGRAFVPHLLTEFVDRTLVAQSQEASGNSGANAYAHGVVVGACGPVSLSNDVRKAIAVLDKKDREVIGGVEFHDEAFHW